MKVRSIAVDDVDANDNNDGINEDEQCMFFFIFKLFVMGMKLANFIVVHSKDDSIRYSRISFY